MANVLLQDESRFIVYVADSGDYINEDLHYTIMTGAVLRIVVDFSCETFVSVSSP